MADTMHMQPAKSTPYMTGEKGRARSNSFSSIPPFYLLTLLVIAILFTAYFFFQATPSKITDGQQLSGDVKNIIFVAGPGSHSYGTHEYRAGAMLLARLLEQNTLNISTTVYVDGWPDHDDAFEGADAIIVLSDGGSEHMVLPHLESLNEYMQRGVGLGVIHYALTVPEGEPGNYFLDWIGGYFETHWSVNPFWTAQFGNIPLHEATKGVNSFRLYDEWYYHMRFTEDAENLQPILTALPPPSSLTREDGPYSNNPYVREAVLERKEAQHLMWLYERSTMPGRGFGLTGGHFHWEWAHPDFRTLTLNAILWIAGLSIPEGGVPATILTIEDLEANQDFNPPDNFDRDRIIMQIENWQSVRN